MGTDGLFDNLYIEEILEIMNHQNSNTNKAEILSNAAYLRSQDKLFDSPHSTKAREAGLFHIGEKRGYKKTIGMLLSVNQISL